MVLFWSSWSVIGKSSASLQAGREKTSAVSRSHRQQDHTGSRTQHNVLQVWLQRWDSIKDAWNFFMATLYRDIWSCFNQLTFNKLTFFRSLYKRLFLSSGTAVRSSTWGGRWSARTADLHSKTTARLRQKEEEKEGDHVTVDVRLDLVPLHFSFFLWWVIRFYCHLHSVT